MRALALARVNNAKGRYRGIIDVFTLYLQPNNNDVYTLFWDGGMRMKRRKIENKVLVDLGGETMMTDRAWRLSRGKSSRKPHT